MPDDRLHFMNAVRIVPGTFSCAVDCFLEVWHTVFNHCFADRCSQSEIINILTQASDLYNQILIWGDGSEQDLYCVRETVWPFLRQHCISFTAIDCGAQF